METLVCTVKDATSVDGEAICSVFMLIQARNIAGVVLTQFRAGEEVGTWRVKSYDRDMVLARETGDLELEPLDYMHGVVERSESTRPTSQLYSPPMTTPQSPEITSETPEPEVATSNGLVFHGKNWKLASERKWKESSVDTTGFECVGEITLKGKLLRVMKGPNFFVAV